ncbi:hypothetical protein [Paenibacillus kobensis]|uniref:hypothetical protein n=1 Tax=Paenibacillus kobensis TaxID=59841 RepID=UPI000FDC4DB0|nr:hypothetical protein [Paenibacillus kobensis]
MTEFDSLMTDFYQKHKKYHCLQSFNLHRDLSGLGDPEYTLEVILCDYPCYEGDQKFRITFGGVRDIKVGYLEGMFALYFNIYDVRDHQLQGIKYRVAEEEEAMFSFYCESFEYEIIE